MKTLLNLSLFSLFLLPLADSKAQSNVMLTIITNSPQGGFVSGGGTFTNGATANVAIQAADGWYITNVVVVPIPKGGLTFPLLLDIYSLPPGEDVTTITNDNESFPLNSNSTMTVTFGTLSPTIIQPPANQTGVTGSSVTLTCQAVGRQALSYRWLFNSNAIAGANTNSLILTNVQSTNAGSYAVVVTNAFGATNSASAVLVVEDFVVLTNGQPVGISAITNLSQVTISLNSRFTNGSMFYTLDGSSPDFSATSYSGPFVVGATCTLRAISYSSDLSQSVTTGPLSIVIVPTFTVAPGTQGGGTIALTPSSQPYVSNTVVTAVATPNPGFVFMDWYGSISGTNSTNTFLVNSNMYVDAHYGTTLGTSVNGSGTISTFPSFPIYPFGTFVTATVSSNAGVRVYRAMVQ